MLNLTPTVRGASLLTSIAALSIIFFVDKSIIRYPAAALLAGSLLAIVYITFERDKTSLYYLSSTGSRGVDGIILLAIALLTIFVSQSLRRLPDWYLVGVIGVSVVVGLRIVVGTVSVKLVLAEIGLLTLSLRWTLWTSYPLYGQDATFHTAITGWIAQTGSLLPDGISYYQNYPASHILGAIGMLIGNLNSKEAFFLTLGLAYVLALVSVYVLSRRILQDRRSALLATLFVAMSTGPLQKGSQIHAQTLAAALFPPLFVVLFSAAGKRHVTAGLVLTAALLAAHNLPPLVLVGVISLIAIASRVVHYIETDFNGVSARGLTNRPLSIGIVAGIGGVYFWISIGYFNYQLNRVTSILIIGLGGATTAISSTNAAAPPAITLFGRELPSLLFWAAPLLVFGIIGSCVGFIMLWDLAEARSDGTTRSPIPITYLIFGLLLSGIFAGVYAVGGNGPVLRSLPVVTVLLSPLFGFLLIRMTRIDIPGLGCYGLVLAVVGIVVIAGVLTPSVPVAARTPQSFIPAATSEDVAMERFAERAPTPVMSDNYLSHHLGLEELTRGDRPHSSLQGVLSNNISTTEAYRNNATSGSLMAYRPMYDSYYGLKVPENSNVIYESGRNKIFRVN